MTYITALFQAGFFAVGLFQTVEPATFDQLIRQAQQQQQNHDLSAAAASYRAALKLRPELAELHANLGLMDYQTSNHKECVEQLRLALKLKPALFVPNLFLGREYLRSNQPELALPLLLQARKTNPDDLEANLTLGRTYQTMNKFVEAGNAYLHAISMRSDNEDAWYGLGVSYLDRAEKAGSLLSQKYHDSDAFHRLQSEYLEGQKNPIHPGERPMDDGELAPAAAHISDLAAAFQAGHYRQAADSGDSLIAGGKFGPATLYWTVKADTKVALQAFERATSINPASPRIHLLLGDLYRRKGNYPDAASEFQKALAAKPGDAAALLGLATTYYLNRQFEEATKTTRQILDQSPDDPQARVLMAQILVEQQKFADASPFLAGPLNEKSELAGRVHALRGKILAESGQTADSIREYKLAVAHDDDGSIHYALARQYQLAGDSKAAAAAFAQSKQLRMRSNGSNKTGVEPDEND